MNYIRCWKTSIKITTPKAFDSTDKFYREPHIAKWSYLLFASLNSIMDSILHQYELANFLSFFSVQTFLPFD